MFYTTEKMFYFSWFNLTDGILDLSVTKNMRKIIADFVNADHDTYCDAFLGKSNKEYCNWILRDDSWGGAIELSILSRYYGLELVVIDAQTGRLDRFGEDQNYDCRGFLLYSGIHYDPLMWEELLPDVTNSNRQITTKTIFSVADNYALVMAQEIGEEAKKSHQYTNVHSFTLQCSVCNKGLTGQHEAVKHAKETGHSNFAEVS